jgi:hypothetical protein
MKSPSSFTAGSPKTPTHWSESRLLSLASNGLAIATTNPDTGATGARFGCCLTSGRKGWRNDMGLHEWLITANCLAIVAWLLAMWIPELLR